MVREQSLSPVGSRSGIIIGSPNLRREELFPEFTNGLYPYNTSLDDEFRRLFGEFTLKNYIIQQMPTVEEIREEFKQNGTDSEYCPELECGEIKIQPIRRKKNKKPLATECVFCKNNQETEAFYKGHILKDAEGKIVCPILRAFTCEICGVNGDTAHTRKYCPQKKDGEEVVNISMKNLKNSIGKRRHSQ